MSFISAFANQHENTFRLILSIASLIFAFCSYWFMERNDKLKTESSAWMWFLSTMLGTSIAGSVFANLFSPILIDCNVTPVSLDFTNVRFVLNAIMFFEMVYLELLMAFNLIIICIAVGQWADITSSCKKKKKAKLQPVYL